jgi:hypothetical protein
MIVAAVNVDPKWFWEGPEKVGVPERRCGGAA